MSAKKGFQPVIVGFLCNWCSYAGADLAGVSRIAYPENLRVIRVMCSGRVDPVFVMEAFLGGADGVMVLGCHPGDCHYISGNYMAQYKMEMARELLEGLGLGGSRLLLDWVSASEGERFAQLVGDFTDSLIELGPAAERGLEGEELIRRLGVARDTVEDESLRWIVGKAYELVEKGNVFGEKLEPERYRDFMLDLLSEDVFKHQVLSAMEEKPRSVTEVAEMLGEQPPRVFRAVLALEIEGKVAETERRDLSPLYRSLASRSEVSNP